MTQNEPKESSALIREGWAPKNDPYLSAPSTKETSRKSSTLQHLPTPAEIGSILQSDSATAHWVESLRWARFWDYVCPHCENLKKHGNPSALYRRFQQSVFPDGNPRSTGIRAIQAIAPHLRRGVPVRLVERCIDEYARGAEGMESKARMTAWTFFGPCGPVARLAPRRDNTSGALTCPGCRRPISLVADTKLAGMRGGLRRILQSVWWWCQQAGLSDARHLQRDLGFSSYATSYSWLQSIRQWACDVPLPPITYAYTLHMIAAPERDRSAEPMRIALMEATTAWEKKVSRQYVGILDHTSDALTRFQDRHIGPTLRNKAEFRYPEAVMTPERCSFVAEVRQIYRKPLSLAQWPELATEYNLRNASCYANSAALLLMRMLESILSIRPARYHM